MQNKIKNAAFIDLEKKAIPLLSKISVSCNKGRE